ncbi:hypothetical protein F4W70_00590 [Pseudomonas cannabina]|nr:hypothetical protein F4W70_00590 [Pseudomonas cannabina]
MGCGAALKPVATVVSGTPKRSVLLPVPDSSRTSEASPGPRPRHGARHLPNSSAASNPIRKLPQWRPSKKNGTSISVMISPVSRK